MIVLPYLCLEASSRREGGSGKRLLLEVVAPVLTPRLVADGSLAPRAEDGVTAAVDHPLGKVVRRVLENRVGGGPGMRAAKVAPAGPALIFMNSTKERRLARLI
jgi:hypothetical protein